MIGSIYIKHHAYFHARIAQSNYTLHFTSTFGYHPSFTALSVSSLHSITHTQHGQGGGVVGVKLHT